MHIFILAISGTCDKFNVLTSLCEFYFFCSLRPSRLCFIMILTWIALLHICLLVLADTTSWTGSLRQQGKQPLAFVFQDMDACVTNHKPLSSLHTYSSHLFCVKKHLLRCILTTNTRKEEYSAPNNLTSSRYCGAIFFNKHNIISSQTFLFIEGKMGYILYYEVLQFSFVTSRAFTCGDHGMVFMYKKHRNESFCGTRVPWTIIIPSVKLTLRLTIKKYQQYQLSMFYNSVKKSWISRLLYVRLLRAISKVLYHKDKINAQYYIVTGYDQRLSLNILSSGLINGSVTVKDGPGHLSNRIGIIDSYKSPRNIKVKTSTFWAFVQVFLHYHNYTNSVIKIGVKTLHINRKISHCVHDENDIYITTTPTYHRNVVCSDVIGVDNSKYYAVLIVNSFHFYGPNKLIHQTSLCEYGGLYVKLDSSDGGFEFCQSVNNLHIHSNKSYIEMTLIWFHGYSEGYFLGSLIFLDCQVFYLERDSHHFHQGNVFIKMKNHPVCYYIVCPPVQTDIQRSCTIQLGPPSLGTTSLHITTRDTLHPCFTNEDTNDVTSYVINATFTDEWPFGLYNNTRTSHEHHNVTQFHKYNFLHSATIKLSLTCNKQSPRSQMALLVQTSKCDKQHNRFVYAVINNIPALSDSCMMLEHTFISTAESTRNPNNYHEFIYKGMPEGYKTTGHEVSVKYHLCPEDCKTFKYSLFVRSIHRKAIIEQTAHVGNITFTGYYHNGFLVKIIEPKNHCQIQLCHLKLHVQKSPHQIGIRDNLGYLQKR